jgi:hypothetical protein
MVMTIATLRSPLIVLEFIPSLSDQSVFVESPSANSQNLFYNFPGVFVLCFLLVEFVSLSGFNLLLD